MKKNCEIIIFEESIRSDCNCTIIMGNELTKEELDSREEMQEDLEAYNQYLELENKAKCMNYIPLIDQGSNSSIHKLSSSKKILHIETKEQPELETKKLNKWCLKLYHALKVK